LGPRTHKYPASVLEDDLTVDHRHRHAYMTNVLDRHLAEFFVRHEKIGRLADFEAALEPFLKRRKGALDGVQADGRGEVHGLVGAIDIPGIVLPVGACSMLNNGASCVTGTSELPATAPSAIRLLTENIVSASCRP
jgi:hypothetical protein